MNLLACAKLHAGDRQQAIVFCRREDSRTVFACIVIRDGDDIQPDQCAHTSDIGRCHIIVSAGRQAGMECAGHRKENA